jgi:DUF2971 family protein
MRGPLGGRNTCAMDMTPQGHLLARIAPSLDDLPNVAYHYTTDAGLQGILRSRHIWATDVRYVNDSSEFQYTLSLVADRLSQLKRRPSEPAVRILEEEWERSLSAAPNVRYFVASFSRDADSLSQWRAYGRPLGYALGFDQGHLLAIASAFSGEAALLRCIYDEQQQAEILDYALTYLRDEYEKRLDAGLPSRNLLTEFGAHFFGHLLMAASCFKHPAFREEQEWRLTIRGPAPGAPALSVKSRPGRSSLIPYVEVAIATEASPVSIASVVVGPCPNPPLAVDALRVLLTEYGFEARRVATSIVPFRDW